MSLLIKTVNFIKQFKLHRDNVKRDNVKIGCRETTSKDNSKIKEKIMFESEKVINFYTHTTGMHYYIQFIG